MSRQRHIDLRPASLLFFIFFLIITTISATIGHAELVDRIVAVVNDDVITLSDVESEGLDVFNKIIATTPAENLEDKLSDARATILETIIDKRLIAQKASALNIQVTDAEVNAAFDDLLERNRITRDQLLAKLESSGVSEKIYKTTIKSQLLQNKLVGTDVQSKIVVTEEMVREHYDENYTSRLEAGSYYLLQMGFSWTDNGGNGLSQDASKLDAQKRAQQVHSLVRSGQDFSTLARKFSDLPSKVDGGDIGTFQLNEMAAYMRDAVVGLEPGETSKIIETPVGYQFFKLLSSGGDETVSAVAYESVKDEIKQKLYDTELKKAYAIWVQNLKSEAYIQKL